MFLQTPTQVISTTTEKHVFSLWEILFSGGILGNVIMIFIFLLGILALYIFLERYFFIKRARSCRSTCTGCAAAKWSASATGGGKGDFGDEVMG